MSTELSDETIIALARKHRTAGTWDSELLALVREAVEADRALRISSCATCGHPVESGGERPAALGAVVPEGCTPADAMVLRKANHALAQESHELQDALADLYTQIKAFVEVEGEADFETGRALYLLSKVRPLEFTWPFTGPPTVPSASGSQESGSTECKESSPLSPANQGIDHE